MVLQATVQKELQLAKTFASKQTMESRVRPKHLSEMQKIAQEATVS
jgi:hypothetical protein